MKRSAARCGTAKSTSSWRLRRTSPYRTAMMIARTTAWMSTRRSGTLPRSAANGALRRRARWFEPGHLLGRTAREPGDLAGVERIHRANHRQDAAIHERCEHRLRSADLSHHVFDVDPHRVVDQIALLPL